MKPIIIAVACAALALSSAACTGTQNQETASLTATAPFSSERIQVRVDGREGLPDLVLIPGLSSSPEIWQETVDRLEGRYRIHRIHVQGFAGTPAMGNSQPEGAHSPLIAPLAEEIARYISQAGLDKPAVIGHSMGGTLGMRLAATHPDAVSKLMVVDMLPFVGAMFGPIGTTAQSVTPTADVVWQAQMALDHDAYIAAGIQSITGMINNESRRELAFEHLRQTDQAVAAAAFRDLIVTDLRPELGQITAPTTVLFVTLPILGDAGTQMAYAGSFVSRQDFKLKPIADSAHFIMFDQPEVFATEVDAFLSAN